MDRQKRLSPCLSWIDIVCRLLLAWLIIRFAWIGSDAFEIHITQSGKNNESEQQQLKDTYSLSLSLGVRP